ncbi:MAG: hypothetical protein RI564_13470 [Gracilimonas sp.]|nr:hypothetical protein [Gracilimonas sp.]
MSPFQKYSFKLLFIFSFILGTTNLFAQEDPSKKNSLEKGSKTLQFQINNNFSLSSFSGSMLSYKKQVTNSRAHRIGLSLGSQFGSSDLEDDPNERIVNNSENNVSFSYTWMNYLNPDNQIKFYYGFGPAVNAKHQKSEMDDINSNRTTKEYTIGLSALGYTGVEWFFHPSISLHAEYQISATGNYTKNESINTNKSTDNSVKQVRNEREFTFGGNGVRFGLSVYF